MQQMMENDTQTDIESTVRLFIETDLNKELQALRLSYRKLLKDWFTSTGDALLRFKMY